MDKTLIDLIFEFDNQGTLTRSRYYTFHLPSYADNISVCRRDCSKMELSPKEAAKACIDFVNEGGDSSKETLRCERVLRVFLIKEQELCKKRCDYDKTVPSYDSKNDSKQVCNLNCYEAGNACFDSTNAGEDTPKGTLRCETEKEACFQECGANASSHNDCDPGMESCA